MAEQPLYFQALYALDVLRETAAADPSILASDVLLAAAEGDLEGMMANGVDGLVEVFNVSHAGITVEDFIRHIGQRPILSGGNSDGDFAMAKWTKLGEDHDSAFSSVTMPRLANLPITATATPASLTAASTRLRGAAGWSR